MFNRITASASTTIPAGTFAVRKPIFGGWGRDENKAREVEAEILPPEHSHGVPARVTRPVPPPASDLDRDEIPVGTFRAGGGDGCLNRGQQLARPGGQGCPNERVRAEQ